MVVILLVADAKTQELDLECKLILGQPIEIIPDVFLRPVTINEIFSINLSKYNQYLNTLCITQEQLSDIFSINIDEINVFEYLLLNSIYNEDVSKIIISALEFFLSKNVFVGDYGFHFGSPVSDKILHRDNFDQFIHILRKANCVIENVKKKKIDPKVQEYLERVKMLKKDMSVNNEDDGIEIVDIISSICARHYNCNFKDISQLTIYQVVNIFKRLHKLDEYFMNLDALIHHGNQEGVELKHYTGKLT
jgi:hypothetical protein